MSMKMVIQWNSAYQIALNGGHLCYNAQFSMSGSYLQCIQTPSIVDTSLFCVMDTLLWSSLSLCDSELPCIPAS